MEQKKETLPVVALRGLAILPDMLVHFDVSRKKSKNALEKAMVVDQQIFLVTQKDANLEDPIKEDLYEIGTIAEVKQLIKLPNDILRVLVEGKIREFSRE